MPFMCKKVVCFDLDDTLYKEIDFLESAFMEIAVSIGKPELSQQMIEWYRKGENTFQRLNVTLGVDAPLTDYLNIYRNHKPKISLLAGVEETLEELKCRGIVLGLITDGRSVSQRNKIEALCLDKWFANENIIISEEFGSEKTDENNFRYFNIKYPKARFFYVGDNPKKDFISPNNLGWETICLLDDGNNIHKQNFEVNNSMCPQRLINKITDLKKIL